MISAPPELQVGDLVAIRLLHSATVILGVVNTPELHPGEAIGISAAVIPAPVRGLTLRFPAELRSSSLVTGNPLTRQPQLSIIPYLFFLALPEESFAWSELASCRVLRPDDLDTRFDYARTVLTDYRQNVARWDPEAVRVPMRVIETR